MDHLVQCPVCTLFLHNGMSLESHLDTHPKDQVIKALCSIANKNSSRSSSRTSTPANSERSYRSRSRTPATEDNGRWSNVPRSSEHDRYWSRTQSGTPRPPSSSREPSSCRTTSRTPSRTHSRTSKTMSSINPSRNCSPDTRMVDNLTFEPTTASSASPYSGLSASISSHSNPISVKVDKMQQTYPPAPASDYDQKYMYYPEHQEDREIKYSRSAEYNHAMETNHSYNYNPSTVAPSGIKVQTNLMPNVSPRKRSNTIKLMPKQNNVINLVKTNIGGVPYLAPNVKPLHVMGNSTPAFVQKNVQNSMIMTGSAPNPPLHIDAKTVTPLVQNHFNQLSSSSFTPGTTVVTQNSQYFYQEMVQNIDPKAFIPSMPTVYTSHENVTNVAQTSSMYQNLMLVDQFGNTSCMYTTPQQIIPKQGPPQMFTDANTIIPNVQKPGPILNDHKKTLIIEVSPIMPTMAVSLPVNLPASQPVTLQNVTLSNVLPRPPKTNFVLPKTEAPIVTISEKNDGQCEAPGTAKGLKILSNIKVEVPVQHNKNMINTVMDLTETEEPEYPDRPASTENIILPDIAEENQSPHDYTEPSTSTENDPLSFAELNKIESPTSSKDSSSKMCSIDTNKLDMEYGDSCPVPDLICNEKPSISPISELSENGDNSTDRTSMSPKPESSKICTEVHSKEKKIQLPIKPFRNTPLRLNNIFVKKNKKVLQIKNKKVVASCSTSNGNSHDCEPVACSSTSIVPTSFSNHVQKTDMQKSMLKTISIEEIKQKEELLAGFEGEHSEEVEPEPVQKLEPPSEVVQVKEELSTSNEGAYSNHSRHDELPALDPLRPINISYGRLSPTEFDDESSNRELLDLEGNGKAKQFVSMMNENYFGDNIYSDYFTSVRGEQYDDKVQAVFKESAKEAFSCNIWGEPSNKENEFVLPNFIHESYKIADSGMDYVDGDREDGHGVERDSKADVLSEAEPPLNICADERMPPRGELSGQESNGDMESSWNGQVYSEVTPSEPYDLIARESWVSDGSELDVTEKRDTLEEIQYPKSRVYTCSLCGVKLASQKELRTHKAVIHAIPTSSSYSISSAIKKEARLDDGAMSTANLLSIDSKAAITSTILYDPMVEESKAKLESLRGLLKQETKRKRKDFICPTCKVDQQTEAAFNAHLKIHPLECLKCGKCFHRRANLALHIKTHLGIKNYKCDVCEKRFITRQKLSEHYNIHTGRAPIKCTLCDDTFRRYSNMLQHRDRHHFNKRAKVRDYVCECGLVVHSRAKLAWHRETHELRPKACAVCGDKFVHAASLARHVRRAHNHLCKPAAGHNVPCPICKQMYLRSNLRTHMQTHSGQRPFACVICNKSFTTKWNLGLHRWTHMSRSSKPFKCTQCTSAFVRRSEYVAHMNSHKAVRPYTCNHCGCRFVRKYNCQRHVREHENDKRYVCSVPECGKSFHRSYYLSEHMKVHSGVRPFACNVCGKTSSNKSNHNKHVKIHHAREPVPTEA